VIVVDTSVWIDHFNGADNAARSLFVELLEADADIGIVDLCVTELLQGFGSDRDAEQVEASLLSFEIVRLDQIEHYIQAADLYRTARRSGRKVRSTIDCLIAVACIHADAPLLHRDRDFDELATCSPLRIVPV
jgi:predicted nucleic acid-binding protein